MGDTLRKKVPVEDLVDGRLVWRRVENTVDVILGGILQFVGLDVDDDGGSDCDDHGDLISGVYKYLQVVVE